MRTRLFLIAGLAVLLLGPAEAWTQFPGGGMGGDRGTGRDRGGRGGWGGDRFGGGRGNFDPNEMFNRMANGKEVWVRSEITNPWGQQMFDMMAQRVGATDGQITRQQYVAYMQQRMAERTGGQPPAAPGSTPAPTASPGTPTPPPGGPPGGPGGRSPAEAMSGWAESMFRRLDLNGDGVLNYDEMPDALKTEREKWDTNHDGFIDLNEFKAYFEARMQQFQVDRGGSPWGGGFGAGWGGGWEQAPAEEEDKKPVVYKTGNLPKDLVAKAPWFEQLDTDKDAQIGLYEWKASGRSIEEFEAIDRNGDGFLTVDEVLRYVNQKDKNGTAVASAASPGGGNGFGMRPGMGNGPPGMDRQRGGRGGMGGISPQGMNMDRSGAGRGGPGRRNRG
jgi:hypothetical protein